MKQKRFLFILKLIFSLGLIALILWSADLRETAAVLAHTNLLGFVCGLAVMAVCMLIRSYKWQLLLRAQQVSVPLLVILNFNYMSLFFNSFFLGTLGGDAFRAYRAIDYSGSTGVAASSVLMDRATGFFAALVLVAVVGTGLVLANDSPVSITVLAVLCLFGVAVAVALLIAFSRPSAWLHRLVLARVPSLQKVVDELISSFRFYGRRPGVLMSTFALSCVYHLGQAVTMTIFAWSVNAPVVYWQMLIISLVVGVVVMIPISLNGLGIQEGTYVFYLQKIGLTSSSALAVAIIARASLILFSLIGGLVFLLHNRQTSQTVVQEANTERKVI